MTGIWKMNHTDWAEWRTSRHRPAPPVTVKMNLRKTYIRYIIYMFCDFQKMIEYARYT